MSRFAATVGVLALTIAATAWAQQSDQVPAADTQKPRAGMTADQTGAARASEPLGQVVNIKFDMTITDQSGGGDAGKKTVSLLIADRQTGFIRSTGFSKEAGQVRLNVDARPQILANGNIRAMIGLEYPSTTQQLTIILEPGKPLVLSQTADPISDRKVTVEVRATVVK
jgi:hypothetical protein